MQNLYEIFKIFINSKKNSFRRNYSRKYGIQFYFMTRVSLQNLVAYDCYVLFLYFANVYPSHRELNADELWSNTALNNAQFVITVSYCK